MKEFTVFQKTVSSVLKIIVILSAVIGTYLSWYAGKGSFMGGSNVFMFFTIQSNIAVAVIGIIGFIIMYGRKPVPHVWNVIKFVGAVSITLTGIVFCFVLAPTMGSAAWNIQNILTHVVVPVAAVADFFVTAVNGDIRKRGAVWVIVPPLLYAIYAGIGYISGWEFAEGITYPYFFLNWGSPAGAFGFTDSLPFMGCMWWILALLVFLIAVGLLYLVIVDALKKVLKR
ncbi:MAG: Pr6Pr family membrane protein [Ruminiclostridium sp.]|nr:Pr6Pr family membrane protein [Ruminiclostridium sp.]